MNKIDSLIETLGNLRNAIWEQDRISGIKLAIVFWGQFMDTFGNAESIVSRTLPILQQLNDRIKSGNFNEANVYVTVLMSKLELARKAMARAWLMPNLHPEAAGE